MKKRIIVFILIAIIIVIACFAFTSITVNASEEINVFKVDRITKFNDENLNNYTLDELNNLIYIQKERQKSAHELAESARKLVWPEGSLTIRNAQSEWWNAQSIIEVYTNRYNELYTESGQQRWDAKKAEYPAATAVWLYMKNLGWNDYVCAGIMGNMMSECGGQTLALQPNIYNPSGNYYGLCQWSRKYYPSVIGTSLETQMNFLASTIEPQMNTYGSRYKSGFNYNQFLQLNSTAAATEAFTKCYERAGMSSLGKRQSNAAIAYNYFVNN